MTNRRIWVADSFEGLPRPRTAVDRALPAYDLSEFEYLAVGLEEVRTNFVRFGLLRDNVCFLKGWFSDTLRSILSINWRSSVWMRIFMNRRWMY